MDNTGPIVTEKDREKSTSKSRKLAEKVLSTGSAAGL